MRKWIKCEHELPELYEDVLMLFDNGNDTNMTVGFRVKSDEGEISWCVFCGGGYYTDCDEVPVYWRSIPALPKEIRRAE